MEKRLRSIFPLLLLVVANLLGMAILISRGEVGSEVFLLCLGMCALSFVVYLVINLCGLGDTYLYLIITMLATVGIVMVSRINIKFGVGNMTMFLGGVLVFFITIFLYRALYNYLKKFSLWYMGLSLVLYILTLVLAVSTNGAKNWIRFGEFSFQPSEFIKILFVLSVAGILTRSSKKAEKGLNNPIEELVKRALIERRMIVVTVITYINIMFLLLQTELGTAVVIFAVYLAFLFVYDKRGVLFLINALTFVLAIAIAILFVDIIAKIGPIDHIAPRIRGWLDPYSDRTGGGWQIINSLREISGGSFMGNGIGNGALTKAERVSLGGYEFGAIESDYIFAAICNEMGVLGGIAVLMLYFVLVYRGFKIALSTTNDFNKAVAFGVSAMLGVQTFVIIGGVTKLIPLTGITLPFISHGGSSMLSTFIAIGLLQAISSVEGDLTDELE